HVLHVPVVPPGYDRCEPTHCHRRGSGRPRSGGAFSLSWRSPRRERRHVGRDVLVVEAEAAEYERRGPAQGTAETDWLDGSAALAHELPDVVGSRAPEVGDFGGVQHGRELVKI